MKIAISLLMLLNASALYATTYAPKVGEPHADFMLPQIDTGQPIRLSQFRGKPLLIVHFASW